MKNQNIVIPIFSPEINLNLYTKIMYCKMVYNHLNYYLTKILKLYVQINNSQLFYFIFSIREVVE